MTAMVTMMTLADAAPLRLPKITAVNQKSQTPPLEDRRRCKKRGLELYRYLYLFIQ